MAEAFMAGAFVAGAFVAGALTALAEAFEPRGNFAAGTFLACRLAAIPPADFLTARLANFLALVFGPDDALRVIFGMIRIY
jgi:hypothetical protein